MLRQFRNYLFGKLSGNAAQYYDGTGAFSVPAGSGGGGLTLLDTQVASASAELDFTSIITATYNVYIFELENVLPATNNTDLLMLFSVDNGATWEATNYYYSWWYTNNVGGSGVQAAGPISEFVLINSVNTADGDGANGEIKLYNPLGAQTRKSFVTKLCSPLPADHRQFNGGGTHLDSGGVAVDAVRFKYRSGNIASGTIYCYGLAK